MSRKKVGSISKAELVLFAPSGEDSVALGRIEQYLVKRYRKPMMEISNAEVMRFCVKTTIEAMRYCLKPTKEAIDVRTGK